MEEIMTVADRMRILRKTAVLSQEQVAFYLAVSRSTYGCYETGKSKPSEPKLRLLCRLYHVPIELFQRNEEGKNQFKKLLLHHAFLKNLTGQEQLVLQELRRLKRKRI